MGLHMREEVKHIMYIEPNPASLHIHACIKACIPFRSEAIVVIINKFGFDFVVYYFQLYWSTNATHKNPDYFPDPEKFDPSRFEGNGPIPYTYVPFGGGPRMCPGKEYARLEILVFIHNVVRRFSWYKLHPNEDVIVDPMPMPAKGLPIRLRHH